jgi:RNA polymerase sigma factor (sigma-70 family)
MSAAPTFRETAAAAEAARAGLLYERYAGRILGFCRKRLRSQEEAEDAVQHTFLNAYRSLRTGTVPRAEAAWLYAIAENVCRESQRAAWRRGRVEVVSNDGQVIDSAAAPEHAHDELDGLADALAELTPNQRRAILLREWQGLSYREIAEELALTEAAVETLLFRARRALARKLDRRRAWGWLDLGSLAAWGKSLLGGTAAKLAAATVVVAAGVTAATPAARHEVLHRGGAAAPVQAAVAPAALALSTAHPNVDSALPSPATSAPSSQARAPAHTGTAALGRSKPSGAATAAPAPPPAGAAPTPAAPPAAPIPATVPGPSPLPVSVTVPPPPAVELPPVPALPLPPVPPPSGVPSVPSVPGVPPLPEVPLLP